MPYGERLAKLNPCHPRSTEELLRPLVGFGARLADIGCGRGATLSWLAEHNSYELYGAEPDDTSYACATVNCPSAMVVKSTADALPFDNDFFHAILMECVFSLTEDPSAVAAEAARVLRGQGFLLLSDLFTYGEDDLRVRQTLLRRVYALRSLEGYFIGHGFLLCRFIDHTRDLRSMFAQMLMDGTADAYLDDETRKQLREVKAGYGIWIFQKV
ncbi:MAG: class I SAM-dependent methyltransferase [Clostridiales bacterium]|nr:class I SAM-dependent methyltransferase [Clostridiales bacterium]